MNNDNDAGAIGEYFRNARQARADTSPLVKPPEIDDPKTPEAKRVEADDKYCEALLQRNPAVLTLQEQSYLRRKIQEALKNPYGE
jgi:hypothetical protein